MRKPGARRKYVKPVRSRPIGWPAKRACISAGMPNCGAMSSTSGRLLCVYSLMRAEREGFEPSMEVSPHTRLAGECLQPLGHLSGQASQSRASAAVRTARAEAQGVPPADREAPLRYNVSRAPGGVAERLNA